ncbi:MAG: hypothetical protein WD738_08405 [Pirellulales bacterium]
MYDEQPLDDQSLENFDAPSSVSTLEPPFLEPETDTPAEVWPGARCEKCDAPLQSDVVTICRRCGWYASLGIFVEVDPNWETETQAAQSNEIPQGKSHLRVWLDLLPRWSWVIIASVLAVIIESIVARLVTPSGSSLRTAWSLSQLGAGVLAAAGCHVFNFLVLAADDADFGVLDIFLKPLKLWIRAAHYLPTRLWVANAALCGVTATVMSVIVIGGIPYERLWDWGFEEPVKQNLMGAVMDRVKELDSHNGDDNLEDAIGDFAGSENVEELTDLPKAPPAKPRSKADCVILGYEVDRDGRLASLLLGTTHRDKLIYAGRVTPNLPDEELQTLLQALEATKSMKAFIPMDAEATWVHPKYTCRITFGKRQKGGRLQDLQWERLIGTINLQ